MKKIIKVDDFEIELTLKKIKNINLRVFPHSGAIKVSAPIGISDERIQKFIKLKKINFLDCSLIRSNAKKRLFILVEIDVNKISKI